MRRRGLVIGFLSLAGGLLAPQVASADVAVNINGPTLTITAIADAGDTAPEIELVASGGSDYEIRYNSSVGMTVTEDSERCTAGGASISEVQCDRDNLTDLVLNADATADTEFLAFFTDDDDVLFTGGTGADILDAGVGGMANADTLNGGDDVDNLEGGDGVDTLNGGNGNDDLDGGDEGDNVNGEEDSDTLDGGAGGDTVSGGPDNDTNVHGGAGVDTVNGNDGTDTIDGDADGDTLNGGIGGDTLRGGAGNDTLNGGDDNDNLNGGQNAAAPQDTDTLNGNADDDDLNNSEGADDFNGGPSNAAGDEVDYSGTVGTASITADSDDVAGDDGRAGEGDSIDDDVEDLTGDDGADTLTGNASANDIDGGPGGDSLRGGQGTGPDGADNFIGGTADDDVSYASRDDDLDADIDGVDDDGGDVNPANATAGCPAGADCEDDNVGADVEDITGGDGDDDLTGDDLDNDLSGGVGDDQLAGGTTNGNDGADELIGGTHGTAGGQNSSLGDEVTYAARTFSVTVDIGGGDNDGSFGCPAGAGCEGDDVRTDIENLTGSAGGDTLTGDGNNNRLLGGNGNNTLAGGQQAGPDGDDVFAGGVNLDRVSYAARTDNLTVTLNATVGGAGPDGDNIGSSIENATGGSGNDVLNGSVVDNTLDGGAGDDQLTGGVGVGADGNDELIGGANAAAGDTVSYASRTGSVVADIGGGNNDGGDVDPTNATPGCPAGADCEDDDVRVDVENLTGGSDADTLTGDGDPNTLTGGDGGDNLSSLGGADRIEAVDGVADTVDCGTESDSAGVDVGLDTVIDCELLGDPPGPPGPPPPPPPPGGGAGGLAVPGGTPANPAATGTPAKKCRKGFKKVIRKGKVKCKRKKRRPA